MEPSASTPAPAVRCRWARAGRSAAPDAATAGAAAARDAVAHRGDARLLLVFAADHLDPQAVLAGVHAVAGDVPVVGSSAVGQIEACGPSEDAVVVLALGGHGLSVSTAAVSDASGDPRDAGARVAACLGDVVDREHRVLLLITDGRIVGQADIVRGAYSVVGAGVPIVGGVIGDATSAIGPAQFHGREVLHGGVVAVAIGSDGPLGIGVGHGHEPVGDPMLVTAAAPGRVVTLDERPAEDVLVERAAALGIDAHEHAAIGLRRRAGGSDVRVAIIDGAPDRSLLCDAPAGSLVWIMDADPERALEAADSACADALGALDGADPAALVVFGCVARRVVLGDDGSAEEVTRVARHAGDAAVVGLYTHGEIARTRGIAGYHNETLVVLAVA
jgi:hypothetical protein